MAQAENPPSLFHKYAPSRTLHSRAQASCCLRSPPVVSARRLSFQWALREAFWQSHLGCDTDQSFASLGLSAPIPMRRGWDSATARNAMQSRICRGQDMALGIPPLLHYAQDRKSDLSLQRSLEQRDTRGHWCPDLSLKCTFQDT